jgi:Bacterial SH3 domain
MNSSERKTDESVFRRPSFLSEEILSRNLKCLKGARVAAVLWLLFFFSATSVFSEEAAVERNSNLRKSASSSSAILAKLAAGSHVTLISDRKRSGYYHVQAEGGAVGWAWARNITASANGEPSPSGTPATPEPNGNGFDAGCTLPFDSIKQKHPIIDDSCGRDGSKKGGGLLSSGKLAENHAKNNFCIPGPPIDISYEDLRQLQQQTEQQNVSEAQLKDEPTRAAKLSHLISVDGHSIGEGILVRLVIHVISGMADYADTATQGFNGESVNCNRPSEEENDIHIPLGEQTHVDECLSVTAEMSPHFRPAKWTPDSINSAGEHPVRITGQLFYDSSHKPCKPGKPASPKRVSLWEIHPVYAFEVCTSSTDIEQCKAAPESAWQPLDQFAP